MIKRWLPSPPLSLALFVVWLLLNQLLRRGHAVAGRHPRDRGPVRDPEPRSCHGAHAPTGAGAAAQPASSRWTSSILR